MMLSYSEAMELHLVMNQIEMNYESYSFPYRDSIRSGCFEIECKYEPEKITVLSAKKDGKELPKLVEVMNDYFDDMMEDML